MQKLKLKLFYVILAIPIVAFTSVNARSRVFTPDDTRIRYTGRIDFSNPLLPRLWDSGSYIQLAFDGRDCDVYINDQELGGSNHNYLEIVVDDTILQRIQTTGRTNIIKAVRGLEKGMHTLLICKNTESGIGFIEFAGVKCRDLGDLPAKPEHHIELIGNSITCGSGSDLSKVPCGSGQWYDQQNAYMSYGPVAARLLNADWMLSSVSGIGLIHSCCNMSITMPQVYDKVDMRDDSIEWDFSQFTPDVVIICLGQNDGIQDSVAFCSAYVGFINKIRGYYPRAEIICLSSPMADEHLLPVLKNYINSIASYVYKEGDTRVRRFFFSRSFNNGCGGHPDIAQHQEMALELAAYIRKVMKW